MQLVSGLAVYFIMWWMILFLVLPWGAVSSHELGREVEPGTMKAAPVKPRILLKFGITTLLAAVAFAIFYVVTTNNLISLDDIPFMPNFRPVGG